MLGREKNNLAAKQWFYSTTCGEKIKHGRKFVLKISTCFWRSREKSFFGRIYHFSSSKAHTTSSI